MVEGFDPALGRRVASAIVLIAAVLAALVAGGWAFGVLVLVCLALMAWEWARFSERLWNRRAAVVAGAAALAVPAFAVVLALLGHTAGHAALLLAVGAALAALMGLALGAPALWTALGVVYLGAPALALIWLRAEPAGGLALVLWLLVVVWATDIAAYTVGRSVGGPRLAPRISPGKTWSGLCGGVAGAALAGAVGAAVIPGADPTLLGSLAAAGALGAVLAVLGQLGDLGESFIKRRAGVKDSSTMIPGHGGVLDRLDSLLATAPALALVVLLRGGGQEGMPWWR